MFEAFNLFNRVNWGRNFTEYAESPNFGKPTGELWTKVFKLLQNQGLLSDERIELLLTWKHTGFSIDNSVTVYPSDESGLERLARYLIRSPVSL